MLRSISFITVLTAIVFAGCSDGASKEPTLTPVNTWSLILQEQAVTKPPTPPPSSDCESDADCEALVPGLSLCDEVRCTEEGVCEASAKSDCCLDADDCPSSDDLCLAPACPSPGGTCSFEDICAGCTQNAECGSKADECELGRCLQGDGCYFSDANICCDTIADCAFNSPCIKGECVAGRCVATPIFSPECCSDAPVFVVGGAGSTPITGQSSNPSVKWQLIESKFTPDPPHVLYVGNARTMKVGGFGEANAVLLFKLGPLDAEARVDIRGRFMLDLKPGDESRFFVVLRHVGGEDKTLYDSTVGPLTTWFWWTQDVTIETPGEYQVLLIFTTTGLEPESRLGAFVDNLEIRAGCTSGPCVVDGDCKSGVPCTNDQCISGVCVSEPIEGCCMADADCVPANACVTTSCQDMKCVEQPVEGCCTENTDCLTDEPCMAGVCVLSTCQFAPIDGCCTDDDQCESEATCTLGLCDLETNGCTYAPVPNCCTEDSECAVDSPCANGVCDVATAACVVTEIPNCCVDSGACDDGKPCTNDVCDPETNTCLFVIDPDCCETDAACVDADPCTSDICVDNVCKNELQPECCASDDACDDNNPCTIDTCKVTGLFATCHYEATGDPTCCVNDTDCAPSPCGPVVCANFECVETGPDDCCASDAECDDSNACTTDVCGPDNTCKSTPVEPLDGVEEICGDGIDNDCNPATLCYRYSDGFDEVDLKPIVSDTSPSNFYGSNASDFTGSDRISLVLHQDSEAQRSLIVYVDGLSDGSGGILEATYFASPGIKVLHYDDGPVNGNDIWDVDEASGTGYVYWIWVDCCYDGLALGYLSETECVDLTFTDWTGLDAVWVWQDQDNAVETSGIPFSLSLCPAL